uniref:Uncharacterized protein n=1 Tax=Glossina palpalis gambiensis TaxID=67801 RepID=A0A1B0BL14_9MUSC
ILKCTTVFQDVENKLELRGLIEGKHPSKCDKGIHTTYEEHNHTTSNTNLELRGYRWEHIILRYSANTMVLLVFDDGLIVVMVVLVVISCKQLHVNKIFK